MALSPLLYVPSLSNKRWRPYAESTQCWLAWPRERLVFISDGVGVVSRVV